MLSYRSTRSLPNFKSRCAVGPWIAAYDALRSRTRRPPRTRILTRGVRKWRSIGVSRHHRNGFPTLAGCKSNIAQRPETPALHQSRRHDSRTRTKRRLKIAPLVLPILLCLSLSGSALAEPVIILDPYFYRTPVSEAIDGSSKTVLGYYDETDGRVTPLSNPPRLAISELHTLAVAYAQSILKQTSPKFIRDRNGVLVAIRIESQDQAFSSVLLTPGFADRFANLLGNDCLVCVPNRQTVFLFPRLGSNMEQFSIPLRGIYHNSVWPVSTELFEWRGGALHSVRDFEPDR
jgi:hypothetical protein